jgi:hypothetical protein
LFNETQNENLNFPSYADNYGKSVAKEVRNMVTNLNKMNVDYSNASNSIAFKEQFYENLYKINPIMVKNTDVINNLPQMNPTVFAERVRNLTDVQLEFIQRIIKECEGSKSYQELSQRLIAINEDIYSAVPDIQQERLFYITAVLYYGVNEIQNLEKQGQMLKIPQNDIQRIRLKSGNNESGGGISGWCRKFLATVWVIAIGEPTPAGEVVASVVTVILGSVLLYEVITCSSSSSSSNYYISNAECGVKYAECVEDGIPQSQCYSCFVYCQGQHIWTCP